MYVKNSKVIFYGQYGTKEGWFVPKINMFQDVILQAKLFVLGKIIPFIGEK